MPQTAIRNAVDADELLRRVGDLGPLIRKHAPEAERNRCLSAAVVDAMREADLYTMARPKAYGGLELDPVSSFRVVEEVARHDSAAGWNLNLSTAGDYFPAWLPTRERRRSSRLPGSSSPPRLTPILAGRWPSTAATE